MDTRPEDLRWAIQLPRTAASIAAVGRLRLLPGIEIGEDVIDIWLRGKPARTELHQELKTLPFTARYVWLADDRLRRWESRLATATLPVIPWQPLASWAQVSLPPARLPASLPLRASLSLVPCNDTEIATSNTIELPFDAWFDWAISAPANRLEPLIYATRADGMTLVIGSPLPSAPGRHLVLDGEVIVPAGFTSAPDVSPAVVRHVLGAGERELVYWNTDGVRLLDRDLFVPATRASVRATRQALSQKNSHAD